MVLTKRREHGIELLMEFLAKHGLSSCTPDAGISKSTETSETPMYLVEFVVDMLVM